MARNKDGWIHVIWLSLTILHVVITSVSSSWNWFEAQKLCEQHNDSLPNPYTFRSEHSYWSSLYRRNSFWIKILGCYKDTSPDDTGNVNMTIPSAGFCQEICALRNSSIFGIKQNECKCFGKLSLEQFVSPHYCITVQTTGDIKFKEHGSVNTYTLYESDFNVTKRDEIYCVAVQCDMHKRFYFQPWKYCSMHYRAVCQNSVSVTYHNWTSSMDICKTEHSSYLAGNFSLNDIEQTCYRLNVTSTGQLWLGIAIELYSGFDLGVPVDKKDRESFLQCAKCIGNDCAYFTNCEEKVNTVYCEKGFSTVIAEHSTTKNEPVTTQSYIHTSETIINFTRSFSRNFSVVHTIQQDVTDSSNTLRIVIPLVVTTIFIGCFATAAVFYIRRKRDHGKQDNNQLDSKDTDVSYVNIDATNTDYVVLQPHSATTYDELHVRKDERNSHGETAEGMYDQLK